MLLDFIPQWNAWAAALVAGAWSHALQLAVLAAILALIDLTVGGRVGPQWRCALWLIFFVKLALPPGLALPSSPAYWYPPAPADAPPVSTQMLPLPAAEPAGAWARTATTPSPATPPEPVAVTAERPRGPLLLVAGWAVGAGCFALGTVRQHRRLRRRLASAQAATPELSRSMSRARALTGLRRPVGLRLTDAAVGPLIIGLVRPVVYLPRNLVARLDPAQIDAVLVHELSHVIRGDLWVAAAQTLARIVFFYHPAVWIVNARVAQLREQATDRTVLAFPTVDPRCYSLALVEAATVLNGPPPAARFALGVIETKSQLKKRITMNLTFAGRGRPRLGAPGLVSLLLLGSLLIPMAPAHAVNDTSAAPPNFQVTDPAPLVALSDRTTRAAFDAFNRRDRDAYVAAFTPDAFMLPDGAPHIFGRAGAAESYLRMPAGLRYEPERWAERRLYQLDRWLIETGTLGFYFRLSPEAPVMMDPRQIITIWEKADDGSLQVKLVTWNKLVQAEVLEQRPTVHAYVDPRPASPPTVEGDFSAVLAAEETFHRAFELQQPAEAASYYAEGATLIPPGTLPLHGQPAILRHLQAVPRDHQVRKVERHVIHIEGNEHHVLVVNLFRWMFSPDGSDVLVPIAGKGVHLWQRQPDGQWRILFDLPNVSQPSAG